MLERVLSRSLSRISGKIDGYGAAQRLYVKRGYIPDGKGVICSYQPTIPGNSYTLDDDLVLWFTKKIEVERLKMIKVVFVPGNGGSTTCDNWFPSVKKELEAYGLKAIAETFPDPDLARESYWIPFLHNEIKVDHNTILVGHSSGAIAAMRFAEQHPILGSVLVGAYYTDLGMEKEKLSGYFSRPWDWEKIRSNQKWISLFASEDDPWIPIEHARYIHQRLNCEYHEYKKPAVKFKNPSKLSFTSN